MRIRVLRAPTMAEAMRLLKQELGPDAALLSTRRVAGGIEVTAGLDEEDTEEPLLIAPLARMPAAPPPPPPPAPPPSPDAAALAFHGVPAALAERLLHGPLEASLEASFRFARLPDGIARPLLLAGPHGAGKTLTTAKIAARRVLAGHPPPLVVTTDGERAGAAEQLASYTRLLGATLAVALTQATLLKAMARRDPAQPVLIDTAGIDPFVPEQARLLAGFAAATGASVALVLPAGLDAAEAADQARAFAAIGATHLLPTRLDVTRRIGAALAAGAAGRLALCEAGTGPGATGSLIPIDPAWLAARLRRRSHLDAAPQEGHPT
ncbi:GTP-binding protein [Falsiroseomonas sp. CW058]|uniref:flagellar biosynthesis protein FlhF n=1 Tax=Falsiroseomonas sp. CW058 TaxID=3388664 RepID=UPI003D31BB92